jgi:hypothetical protein
MREPGGAGRGISGVFWYSTRYRVTTSEVSSRRVALHDDVSRGKSDDIDASALRRAVGKGFAGGMGATVERV